MSHVKKISYISIVIERLTMNKNYRANRYPNGYAEKIGYWKYKLNCAIEVGNVEKLEYAAARLVYFLQRQEEVNNRMAQLYID